MIAALIYILLFSVIILKSPFFHIEQFGRWRWQPLNVIFLVKVACGFALTWIYTHYYKDRQSADIFKYYDDAEVMFSAAKKGNWKDYLQMLFGFSNNSEYFDLNYYTRMNHWYRQYDFGTYNDNHTIIRFNALVMLFAFGSFHVHTVFMCFVSLSGLTALYRAFAGFLTGKQKLFFILLFTVPSILFWGSGVLKEGILLFSIGFLCLAFVNIFQERRRILLNTLLLLFTIFLLSINKQYLLAAIIPALICFLLVRRINAGKPFLVYITVFAGGFALVYAVLLFNGKSIAATLAHKQDDFIALAAGGVFLQNGHQFVRIDPEKKEFLDTLADKTFRIRQGSHYMYWKNENLKDTLYVKNNLDSSIYKLVWDLPKAGSVVNVPALKPTFISLISYAPDAIYMSLCKPGLFSAKSVLERVSAIENTLLLLFLAVCTVFSTDKMNRNLFWFCFFVAVPVLLLIGYTTPIAGAIVRYKVPVIPFILLCGVVVLDPKRLKIFSDKTKP